MNRSTCLQCNQHCTIRQHFMEGLRVGIFLLYIPAPRCVKKKWLSVLFADSKTNQPTTYHLNGNSRGEGGSWGKWQISKAADGRVIYHLYSERETKPLELIVIDENTLAFADQEGRILVGNEDFSFTLSK